MRSRFGAARSQTHTQPRASPIGALTSPASAGSKDDDDEDRRVRAPPRQRGGARADAGQDGRFQGGAEAGAALPGRRRRGVFAPLAALAGGQSEGTGLSLGIDDPREGTVLWVIGGFFFATYYNWAKEQPDSDSDLA